MENDYPGFKEFFEYFCRFNNEIKIKELSYSDFERNLSYLDYDSDSDDYEIDSDSD